MMMRRMILGGVAILLMTAVVWLFFQASKTLPLIVPDLQLVHTVDGLNVYALRGSPRAYLLEKQGRRILIDCPGTANPDVTGDVDFVLLTHHHRDSVDGAGHFLKLKVPVRANRKSAEWLTTEAVAKFWKESIPLRNSRTAYFVHPTGFDGLDCTLDDGQQFEWNGCTIRVLATPGHSVDHLAFQADGLVFTGDALTAAGKLWTPFTTDWDHWTDSGLNATAASVRLLRDKALSQVFPARGSRNPNAALDWDAALAAIDEAAFCKSFERFTNRLGDPPKYDVLVPKEQVGSGGDKPWSKISDSLWITGNTYVLKSKESNGVLVFDPWGQRSVDQVAKLREAEKLGAVELVMFSHAHFDHFDGVYTLPEKGRYEIWSLDRVAEPLREPFRFRAPFLDERPIAFDKLFKNGETGTWREYAFKFHHLPGQTDFTAGIACTIDGKSCLFTADNFFHFTQYSGTGGWMGLNRSTPRQYANSARLVSNIGPEWVLAEHGGPFVFNAEDFKRRAQWGDAAAKACDAVCSTGNQYVDWNPHGISIEPVRALVKPGETVAFSIPSPAIGVVTLTLQGRGLIADQTWAIQATKADQTQRFTVTVPETMPRGRHVFAIDVHGSRGEPCDPVLVLDVE